MTNYSRIRSPIVQVRWAGWESNTLALQRAGWEISADQKMDRDTLQIALKHPGLQLYGLSQEIPVNYMAMRGSQYLDWLKEIMIPIQYMSANLQITIMNSKLNTFEPIDAMPVMTMDEPKSIEDFNIFKTIGNCKDIIIAPKDISSVLDDILKRQAPLQRGIREKKRKEWRRFEGEVNQMQIEQYDPRKDIVAQLITI